ncbi:MAG: 2-oxo acid dehydrogenase subunit E2 [Synergistaceae bacterium]|nr:2-oxo acid dehydrogenase subunit E2 [Synergistaceae bacterium]
MAVQIRMPKLGMMEGDLQLVRWKKNQGDTVNKGDALATVESQKITNDVEASTSGTILKICLQEGDIAPIGAVIAIIGEIGEDISVLEPKAQAPAATRPSAGTECVSGAPIAATVGGSGDIDEDIIKASPVAKKLAKDNGISLSDVAAVLGTTKRLQGEDVQRYIDEGMEAAQPKLNYTETKLIGMRKTIAERMSQSSHETAPVVMMRSADITALKSLRDKKKAEIEAKGEKSPSFNDVIIKAVALALESHPRLNSTFENGVIRTYSDININIAMAIEAGLVTPVIRGANKLKLSEISTKARELAGKANAGTLSGEDMSGGTFTVTNLGMLEIEVSTPILNSPQVAILAIGMVQPYLVMENGAVVERFKTFFSLTLDHRIVDGYPGAQYLYTLVEILQQPERLWN